MYFKNFRTLQELVLSYNRLTQISDLTPISDTLIYLYLTGNAISEIPYFLYEEEYQTLGYIALMNNRINQIPIAVYFAWPSIYKIRLSGNNLSSINLANFIVNTTASVYFKLGFNPWRCDSALTSFMGLDNETVETEGPRNVYHRLGGIWIMDYKNMKCAEPLPLEGMWLGDLSEFIILLRFTVHANDSNRDTDRCAMTLCNISHCVICSLHVMEWVGYEYTRQHGIWCNTWFNV